ncbi:hypothetical protein [Paenibacillus violae]|uniref:hypothetical protein n=1 Tax=Paenibacillus violae TaxID=3077234 RepID=UPI0028FC0B7E|nr:hypothetical protein [Paenibacillus sp. PFR10]
MVSCGAVIVRQGLRYHAGRCRKKWSGVGIAVREHNAGTAVPRGTMQDGAVRCCAARLDTVRLTD